MTIGRTTEAPAAYALTSTIKRLLDHLTEARLFSPKDLTSISNTLGRLEGILRNADSQHSPYLVELLAKREALCKSMLGNLRNELNQLDEPLQAVYEKLISIMRSMSLANTKSKVNISSRRPGEGGDTILTPPAVLHLRSPEAQVKTYRDSRNPGGRQVHEPRRKRIPGKRVGVAVAGALFALVRHRAREVRDRGFSAVTRRR